MAHKFLKSAMLMATVLLLALLSACEHSGGAPSGLILATEDSSTYYVVSGAETRALYAADMVTSAEVATFAASGKTVLDTDLASNVTDFMDQCSVIIYKTSSGLTDKLKALRNMATSSSGGTTSSESTSSVTAVWDFSATALGKVGLTTTAAKAVTTDNIDVKSGSGATLGFTSTSLGKSVKIQNATSGGINIGSGTGESDVFNITVDDACTLKFTGKGSSGGTWTSSSVNSFSVADTTVYKRTAASETSSQSWTYKCTAAGTYRIKASGMIFTELACQ